MSESAGYAPHNPDAFARYLAAKRTIDDRSLNQHVYGALCRGLAPVASSAPVRILDAGCGIGTMIDRLDAWGFLASLPSGSTYRGIDAEGALIARARDLHAQPLKIELAFEAATLLEFAARPHNHASYDLLIAHALLDLLDLKSALPALFTLLRGGALGWLTVNFDGITHFEPAFDVAFDAQVEALYHRTMDQRVRDGNPSGDSRTGRHLLTALVAAGFEILAAGSSDWIVFPSGGRYRDDDAWFLTNIVDTVFSALVHYPELPPESLDLWHKARREQIEDGQLCYIAHQIDFLVRRPGASVDCE